MYTKVRGTIKFFKWTEDEATTMEITHRLESILVNNSL